MSGVLTTALHRLYRAIPRRALWAAAAAYAAAAGILAPRKTARRRRWLAGYASRVGWPLARLDAMMRATYLVTTLDHTFWVAPAWPDHPPFTVEGETHLREALAEGRGAVVTWDHIGAHELIRPFVHRRGYPSTFVLPADRTLWRLPPFARALRWLRRRTPHTDKFRPAAGVRDALAGLARGEAVLVTADGDAGQQAQAGILGAGVARPTGPVRIALRTGSPIVVMTAIPEPGARYRLRIHPPIRLDPHALRGEAIRRGVEQIARVVDEDYLACPWIARRRAIDAFAGEEVTGRRGDRPARANT